MSRWLNITSHVSIVETGARFVRGIFFFATFLVQDGLKTSGEEICANADKGEVGKVREKAVCLMACDPKPGKGKYVCNECVYRYRQSKSGEC